MATNSVTQKLNSKFIFEGSIALAAALAWNAAVKEVIDSSSSRLLRGAESGRRRVLLSFLYAIAVTTIIIIIYICYNQVSNSAISKEITKTFEEFMFPNSTNL